MAGIESISGGSAGWQPVQTPLQQMADAMIAADPRMSGIAVQRNGMDATAAAPIAAGPAAAGPSPIPAMQQSGIYVSMPGSREAYERHGIPPIMYQTSPYATAAYRAYTDPYGQMGVQPLIGFPSAYPHVLSGVPNSPFRLNGILMQDIPFTPLMAMMAAGQFPPQQQAPAPAPARQAAPRRKGTTPTTSTTTTQAATKPSTALGGPYDETKWRNRNMPVPPPALGGPYDETKWRNPNKPVPAEPSTYPYEDDGFTAVVQDWNPLRNLWNYVLRPVWDWAAVNSPNRVQ